MKGSIQCRKLDPPSRHLNITPDMDDLHLPDSPPPSAPLLPLPSATTVVTTTTTTTPSPPPSTELLPINPTSTVATTTNLGGPSLAPKRQRRPSVRLGDIGGEPTSDHSNFRRPKSSWKYHKDPSVAIKNSKSRPLTNLVNNKNDKNGSFSGGFDHYSERSEQNAEFTHKKLKSKKPIKRARTNWKFEGTPHASLNGGLGVLEIENDADFRDGNGDNGNDFRELEAEDSESPVNSRESLDDRRRIRSAMVWESSRGHNEINGTGHNNEEETRSSRVKDWLIGLGLGRYAPVFEIHEVDEEVLAMLTLEDLKDMGINAVGSRRKMYTAIEKLRKEFSCSDSMKTLKKTIEWLDGLLNFELLFSHFFKVILLSYSCSSLF